MNETKQTITVRDIDEARKKADALHAQWQIALREYVLLAQLYGQRN